LEFVKILIFITVDIFKHTAKKNKKIKRADQILSEVYGTTLNANFHLEEIGTDLLTSNSIPYVTLR
jgi:hypothetical protein